MKIPEYTNLYVGWLENYMEICQKEIETPFAFSNMAVKGQQWHTVSAGFTEGSTLSSAYYHQGNFKAIHYCNLLYCSQRFQRHRDCYKQSHNKNKLTFSALLGTFFKTEPCHSGFTLFYYRSLENTELSPT